jgi:large subunit ribosomal protein L5
LNETPQESGAPEIHTPQSEGISEIITDSEMSETENKEVEATKGDTAAGETQKETTPEEEPEKEETSEGEIRRSAPPPQGTHSMREIKVGKVVVNITTGQSGESLERAMTILENLTGQRPCTRQAKQTIRTFGIRKNEPIACLVTLRGGRAEDFLRKGLMAVGNRINLHSFDQNGNFAFGIKEHIDIPGQRYDPNLGITGMDVMVTMERPGYRVARKRRARSRVGWSHRVTREEAIEFIKNRFGVEVGPPSE